MYLRDTLHVSRVRSYRALFEVLTKAVYHRLTRAMQKHL